MRSGSWIDAAVVQLPVICSERDGDVSLACELFVARDSSSGSGSGSGSICWMQRRAPTVAVRGAAQRFAAQLCAFVKQERFARVLLLLSLDEALIEAKPETYEYARVCMRACVCAHVCKRANH